MTVLLASPRLSCRTAGTRSARGQDPFLFSQLLTGSASNVRVEANLSGSLTTACDPGCCGPWQCRASFSRLRWCARTRDPRMRYGYPAWMPPCDRTFAAGRFVGSKHTSRMAGTQCRSSGRSGWRRHGRVVAFRHPALRVTEKSRDARGSTSTPGRPLTLTPPPSLPYATSDALIKTTTIIGR